jgi:membrane protease YdiL (CAAX protease family)
LEGRARTIVRVELLVLFFAAAAPNLVFGLSGISDPRTVQTDIPVLTLIASLLAALSPAAIAIYLLWRDGFLADAGFGRPRPMALLGNGALAFVCALGAAIGAGIIVTAILTATGHEIGNAASGTSDKPQITLGFAFTALAISATAGVSEEAVYRGYGITRMEQAGWPRAALFVPLLVWTAQHLYAGPIAVFVVGCVGIPFVWLFWWKRSVWPLMVGHACYDLLIFFINTKR